VRKRLSQYDLVSGFAVVEVWRRLTEARKGGRVHEGMRMLMERQSAKEIPSRRGTAYNWTEVPHRAYLVCWWLIEVGRFGGLI
jgi:hypothetical protein